MAKSKFEYVRQYEDEDKLLPNCWIVIRIDGKGFHKFSDAHNFIKPNDSRALHLMNKAADVVMKEFKEVILAYGQSDEYSFVFRKETNLYGRRKSKLISTIVSLFASSYVYYWGEFFGEKKLQNPPAFDGRAVLYPTIKNIRDYLSWRQADCHINNLYNTCFWKLVQDAGMSKSLAEERLRGTLSSDKNELLFTMFTINYNKLPEMYRKGTLLFRQKMEETIIRTSAVPMSNGTVENNSFTKVVSRVTTLHCDIIGDQFWQEHSDIFGNSLS
ncbi:putative tRNA(His) guanylyltransferase isoform X2 [Tubulanus polymorphus]|uniref:putative tRNA(His) guanylyltransferase isoform X2 n=1 Tax=Tubulanus polymorphus TaxID=672921 RepID=UPI003DA4FEB2